MTTDGSATGFPAGLWLRAIRRRRKLSQRELAAVAEVSLSTISAIEAGTRTPGLALFSRVLAATKCTLAIIDAEADADGNDAVLELDAEHDSVRDRAGRRFPAHLIWDDTPGYLSLGRPWWGWDHLQWERTTDIDVPAKTYWHRPRPARAGEWREHPWWGMYQARQERPTGQSRPSDGPPEPPPA